MLIRRMAACCTILIGLLYSTLVTARKSTRITQPWEFLKGDMGGIWEAVRPAAEGSPESVPLWQTVMLSHCFNARDGVDPDQNYYEGPGWYSTLLNIHNPFDKGRTVLHLTMVL